MESQIPTINRRGDFKIIRVILVVVMALSVLFNVVLVNLYLDAQERVGNSKVETNIDAAQLIQQEQSNFANTLPVSYVQGTPEIVSQLPNIIDEAETHSTPQVVYVPTPTNLDFQKDLWCSPSYLRADSGKYYQVEHNKIGRVTEENENSIYLEDTNAGSTFLNNIDSITNLIGANPIKVIFCVPSSFPQNIIIFTYCDDNNCNNPYKYGVYKSGQNEIVGTFDTKFSELSVCDYIIGITEYPEHAFYFQCESNTTGNKKVMELFRADMLKNKIEKLNEFNYRPEYF